MTSLLIGCGNLGKIILEGLSKKKKKILVLEKILKFVKILKKNFPMLNVLVIQKKLIGLKSIIL